MKKRNAFTERFVAFAELSLPAVIVLAVLVLLSPPNSPVLGRDEGVFVYIGQQILHGRVPYRDIWDHKGPLIYYIDAIGLALGHNNLWGIWLMESIFMAASLILLYRILRSLLAGGPATFGILTWLAGFTIVMGGNIIEEYAVLLAVASLYIVLYKTSLSILWAGVLAGLAFLLRPNEIAAPFIALLFLLGDQVRAYGWEGIPRDLMKFGLVFLSIVAIFAGYFAWNHALDDLIHSVFQFNYYYISEGGNRLSGLLSGISYLSIPAFFSFTCLLSILFLKRPSLSGDQKKLLYFAAWVLVLTVPLSLLSGRTYRHYYISWLLPMSIFSAYFCFFLGQSKFNPRARNAIWIAAWSVLVVGAILGVRIRAVPLLTRGYDSGQMQTIMSIKSFVPEDKLLLIWGNETAYAVMADRTLAGRYVYLTPLLVPGYGEDAAVELLSDIKQSRPIIIDTSSTDPDIPSLNDSTPPFSYLSDLYSYVHENYAVIGVIAGKQWVVWGPK